MAFLPNAQSSEKRSTRYTPSSKSSPQRPYSPVPELPTHKDTESRIPDSYHDITSSMSSSEEHELDEVVSLPGSDNDEETGLTSAERRRYLRRKRRKNQLDTRIADQPTYGSLSKEAARLADRRVLRSLIINSLLIAAWYTFSLSISIVSLSLPPWTRL